MEAAHGPFNLKKLAPLVDILWSEVEDCIFSQLTPAIESSLQTLYPLLPEKT